MIGHDTKFPTFIIIGAAKSGTTAFYEYLRQHPQIFMSAVKEPHFFCYEGQKLQFGGPPTPLPERSVTNLIAYQHLFENSAGYQAVGEASPFYLYLPQTAENICKHIPGVKLIAVLRNPVERAFSNYLFLVRDGREMLDFRTALDVEAQRIAENWEPIWHYTRLGFYSQQLEHYYRFFPPEQLHVVLYDEFRLNPLQTLQSVFRFIGVDDNFVPDMSYRPNPSGRPRSSFLHRAISTPNFLMSVYKWLVPQKTRRNLKQAIQMRNLEKIPFDPTIRTELTELYRSEILTLQAILGRNLSHWILAT